MSLFHSSHARSLRSALAGPKRFVRRLRTDRAAAADDARILWRLQALRLSNLLGRRRVVGDGGADVCLTTYGRRIPRAYLTIESIARGTARPRRLILWLDDEQALAAPPATLRRLRRRGLEIRGCPDYGPHKKQFPYVSQVADGTLPFVTADDDQLYPRAWLAGLLAAHAERPDCIQGYRAHRVVGSGTALAPYDAWQPATTSEASFAVFCTGVAGILYPTRAQQALREAGPGFATAAPTADDVWVHAVAVRAGVRSRQIGDHQRHFLTVPGSQAQSLFRTNVVDHGNDDQIRRSYGPLDVARIIADGGGTVHEVAMPAEGRTSALDG